MNDINDSWMRKGLTIMTRGTLITKQNEVVDPLLSIITVTSVVLDLTEILCVRTRSTQKVELIFHTRALLSQ
jgi:hypothetical protein